MGKAQHNRFRYGAITGTLAILGSTVLATTPLGAHAGLAKVSPSRKDVDSTNGITLFLPQRLVFSVVWMGASAMGALLGWECVQRRRRAEVRRSVDVSLALLSRRDAVITWAVSAADKADLMRQGQTLAVRLYDVTTSHTTHPRVIAQFHCVGDRASLQMPLPVGDRDYAAELGSLSNLGEWLSVAWSPAIHSPANLPDAPAQRVELEPPSHQESDPPTLVGRVCEGESSLTLTPGLFEDFHVHWQLSTQLIAHVQHQGGRKQMLRIHDVTGLEHESQAAHSTQQYECSPEMQDMHILIARRDRDYVAELGSITANGKWLSMVRSTATRIVERISVTESLLSPGSARRASPRDKSDSETPN